MGAWSKWIEKIKNGPGGPGKISSLRWLLIIGLIGAFLMLFSSVYIKDVGPSDPANLTQEPSKTAASGSLKEKSKFQDYEEAYQAQLRDILQKIVGVGDVEVLVTIESTEEQIMSNNNTDTQQLTVEKDPNGGTRNITDVTRSGEVVMYQVSGGSQQPLVTKYIKPKIRGVLVVATGAENLTVKKMITEAVGRGLEVPPHKISIMPRKQ